MSLGRAAMAGITGLRGTTVVVTSCDGAERVLLEGSPTVLKGLEDVALTEPKGAFVLVEGERFRRTLAQQQAGLDGSLVVTRVRDAREVKPGDCQIEDDALTTLPQDAWAGATLAFTPGGRLAANLDVVLPAPPTPTATLDADAVLGAAVIAWTEGWCGMADGVEEKRAQAHKLTTTVRSADAVLGRWTLSCGRARSIAARVDGAKEASVPATMGESAVSLTVSDLALRGLASGLSTATWLDRNPADCLGTACNAVE